MTAVHGASQEIKPMTNFEFARRVGCHHTMASRLRSGERVPSAGMLAKIVRAFGDTLTPEDIQRMFGILAKEGQTEAERSDAFGAWIRDAVFERAA